MLSPSKSWVVFCFQNYQREPDVQKRKIRIHGQEQGRSESRTSHHHCSLPPTRGASGTRPVLHPRTSKEQAPRWVRWVVLEFTE